MFLNRFRGRRSQASARSRDPKTSSAWDNRRITLTRRSDSSLLSFSRREQWRCRARREITSESISDCDRPRRRSRLTIEIGIPRSITSSIRSSEFEIPRPNQSVIGCFSDIRQSPPLLLCHRPFTRTSASARDRVWRRGWPDTSLRAGSPQSRMRWRRRSATAVESILPPPAADAGAGRFLCPH